MRGWAAAILLVATLLAGCSSSPREVPLDDLLVRAEDLPDGWRLVDFNRDLVEGDALYPMATNPQSFSRIELEAVNWGGTEEARASAFVRDDDPERRFLMFWAGRLEDAAAVEAAKSTTCFTPHDVLPLAGRNAAFVVSYPVDDLPVARQALEAVAHRTGAGNPCPAQVAKDVDGAAPGAWGVPTMIAPTAGPDAYPTFRFTLEAPANVTLDGRYDSAVLLAGGEVVAVAGILRGGYPDAADLSRQVVVAPGEYALRIDAGMTGGAGFTLSRDPPGPESAGHHA